MAFSKKGVILFKFLCFSFKFWKSSFWCVLKHYKNRVSACFVFLLLNEEKRANKNDYWNFWIWVALVQNWPFRDAYLLFQQLVCWNLYFYSVFRVRAFGAKLSKKGDFGPPKIKQKLLTDNWKANIGVFFWFVFSFLFLLGGFKGQVRWPGGPPHLALNPPYLFFIVFFWGGGCFFWRV